MMLLIALWRLRWAVAIALLCAGAVASALYIRALRAERDSALAVAEAARESQASASQAAEELKAERDRTDRILSEVVRERNRRDGALHVIEQRIRDHELVDCPISPAIDAALDGVLEDDTTR